jgi:hypothetical protein
MAQEPKTRRVVEILPSVEEDISALGSANAPIIYFEAAPAYGHVHGSIIRVTLTTSRVMPSGGEVKSDHVVVAHLRMSHMAAQSLKNALERALLAALPKPTNKPN